ncbi:uncharacterized protein LOC107269152 [Cephus cinctus]|uniref:Uncharacterized protein LOC107269152 n=1 Tax=Cephus cinctus TaxID=211228 RepID=A0AAJ7RKV0_CEPCN|nr:uncharacterized protein LOC107269152 [Cephus cinctus]
MAAKPFVSNQQPKYETPLLPVSTPSSNTLSSPVSVVLAKIPSSVSVSLPNISSSVSATRASSTTSSSGSASVAGISSSISLSVPASTYKVHPELPKPDTHPDGVFQNCHSKPKSQVWDSFTKVNFISARCKICTNVLKHGGNTPNFKQHLDRKYPLPPGVSTGKEQKGILNFKSTSNKKWRAENEDKPAPIEVEMRRSNENSRDGKIDTASQRVHSFTAGGTTADNITNEILFILATDNCLLSVVENEGFLNLMKITAPLYNVPSRRMYL